MSALSANSGNGARGIAASTRDATCCESSHCTSWLRMTRHGCVNGVWVAPPLEGTECTNRGEPDASARCPPARLDGLLGAQLGMRDDGKTNSGGSIAVRLSVVGGGRAYRWVAPRGGGTARGGGRRGRGATEGGGRAGQPAACESAGAWRARENLDRGHEGCHAVKDEAFP